MNNIQSMNAVNVQIFNSDQFGQIRTAGTSDNPLFCLADVCRILDLNNPSQVKTRLKESGVYLIDIQTLYNNEGVNISTLGNSITTFVSENNLYKCIFQSRKKEAEQFQDWVTSEVLPSIRKHGGYIHALQEDTPELIMARALQVAQATIDNHRQQLQIAEGKIDHLTSEVKVLVPKAAYTDTVLQSISTYTMTQVAKELGMSAVALERELKDRGIMFRQSGQWLLYSRYQDKGYTKTRTHHYTHSDGSTGTNTITVWTEKGREFIHQILKDKKIAI